MLKSFLSSSRTGSLSSIKDIKSSTTTRYYKNKYILKVT